MGDAESKLSHAFCACLLQFLHTSLAMTLAHTYVNFCIAQRSENESWTKNLDKYERVNSIFRAWQIRCKNVTLQECHVVKIPQSIVCRCIPLYAIASHCIRWLHTIAYNRIPSHTIVYHRIPSHTIAYHRIPSYTVPPTDGNRPHQWKMRVTPPVEIILLTPPRELCKVILVYPRSGNKEKTNGKYLSRT